MKFMKYAVFFYTSVGIEPYTIDSRPKKVSLWSNLLFWANVINLSVIVFGEILYLGVAYSDGKFIDAVTVLSYIGFVIVGMSKMFFIWWKKTDLSNLVKELEHIYPNGKAEEEVYRLDSYLRSCSRISITYAILYSALIWTFNLFSIMQFLVNEKWLKIRVVGQTLPYLMYFPWNWHENWTYYVLLFCQNFAGHTSASGQISTDLLLCAVATQSSSLSISAYKQNWQNDDIRYRRALVFFIARPQRTTYLKATIFMNITRATMTELLQVSYKFFALLRTMYIK
ncbi:odorant receptor 85c isoform X3 [Drosophila sechellia]|uniref:odorant receptor 85c isoform X3 n=1 Tax=Drosophila sechellia TaxID=7238 RepID=UPI0013DDDAE4|nr:odorant receptor 85c isoform X3 [Drosophila sechellia]